MKKGIGPCQRCDGMGWYAPEGALLKTICKICLGQGQVELSMRDLGYEEMFRVTPERPNSEYEHNLILRIYQSGKPVSKSVKDLYRQVLDSDIKEVLILDENFLMMQIGATEVVFLRK